MRQVWTGALAGMTGKPFEISVIYWDYLLNWIDFQQEIVHDMRSVGGIKTTKAKYLILLYIFGKRS
jgi:hypothetical protein